MDIVPTILLLTALFESLQVNGESSNCRKIRPKHGRVKLRQKGRTAVYKCSRGYKIYGFKRAYCIKSAWNHPVPVCVATGCSDIQVDNTTTHIQAVPGYRGAVVRFSCKDGLTIQGNDILYCDGTAWNDVPPKCVFKLADLDCTFESQDLCGWTQDFGDDFDWLWHSGKPKTIGTGPSNDHTFSNTSKGHYLYIDASDRKEGDKANLISPLYQSTGNNTCFEFWYHMLFPNENTRTGSLEVFIVPQGENLTDKEPAFRAEGDKGDMWIKGSTYIGARDTAIQVVIVATRSNTYVSDIAIDDVRIYNCSEDLAYAVHSSYLETTTKSNDVLGGLEDRIRGKTNIVSDTNKTSVENLGFTMKETPMHALGSMKTGRIGHDITTSTTKRYTEASVFVNISDARTEETTGTVTSDKETRHFAEHKAAKESEKLKHNMSDKMLTSVYPLNTECSITTGSMQVNDTFDFTSVIESNWLILLIGAAVGALFVVFVVGLIFRARRRLKRKLTNRII